MTKAWLRHISLLLGLSLCGPVTAVANGAEDIQALSVYVYDVRANKVIFSKSEKAQLPIASITKIATAFAALELLGQDSTVEITPEALLTEGDSGLLVGESWNTRELVKFMLIASSNDAARALELAAGKRGELLARMNEISERFSLSQTYFLNTSGLDVSATLAGAYSSAKDISRLMVEFGRVYPDVLKATSEEEDTFLIGANQHKALNTNKSIPLMTGLLGSKTGSTDLAGANLTIIFDSEIGRPIVATSFGSSSEQRFPDTIKLIYQTIERLNAEPHAQ
jgi:serine-type D-Ala-D-Ala carboxypeptidase (penicillin-binding protein 5/6)